MICLIIASLGRRDRRPAAFLAFSLASQDCSGGGRFGSPKHVDISEEAPIVGQRQALNYGLERRVPEVIIVHFSVNHGQPRYKTSSRYPLSW
jgi:hypothetical protein